MFYGSSTAQVYLALGSTDMRKSINGLSILVQEHLEMNPLSGHLFVFCNRSRNMVKVLYWDRNGFCLWYNQLSSYYTSSASRVADRFSRDLFCIIAARSASGFHRLECLFGIFGPGVS